MRIKLKKYHNKTITIYGYFQVYGSARPRRVKDESGKKSILHPGPTVCIASISKGLNDPLCDHAWISGKTNYKKFKELKVTRDDLLKIKAKVIRYDNKENYTFNEIKEIKKVDNKIIKYYHMLIAKLFNR